MLKEVFLKVILDSYKQPLKIYNLSYQFQDNNFKPI